MFKFIFLYFSVIQKQVVPHARIQKIEYWTIKVNSVSVN